MPSVVARIPLEGQADILGALAAHTDACVRDLRRHPSSKPLYASGVRYDARDPAERWQLPSETRARGRGDCEDLASYRCAELRLAGESCRVIVKRTGPNVLHAVVERADGRIEDPSRRLGMGRRIGAAMATMSPNVRWKIVKTADGWEGQAEIPLPGARAAVATRAAGRTRGDAAARTLKALEDVSRSPLVNAFLPPGAQPAIRAAMQVARSVARLFKRKKKKTVSGQPITRRNIEDALRRRGAPAELVRLGGACWG